VPAIRTLDELTLTNPVTFFVGANGSGKSTLLEALAAAARLPAVGSQEIARDTSLEAQRRLARALTLTWTRRTHRGFFLRAEDFFGFARRIAALREEMTTELAAVPKGSLGATPFARSLAEMESRYGPDLDAMSHGESFLHLFRGRFVPDGLYLLDEPEAALSPQSQLALLVLLREMVAENAQFIIATHSPILMAFPDATIWSFDHEPPSPVPFEDVEHVCLTRDFLEDPGRYLRRLFDDAGAA
jgi:predicted ATPase